jgi:hypothetical protein
VGNTIAREMLDKVLEPIKEVAREAIESGEAYVTAPNIVVSQETRRRIIEEWFNPENNFNIKRIAEKLAIPEEVASIIVGLHPDIREAEEARHRANLYALRRKLDGLLDRVTELITKLADSESSKDWDMALAHIRKLITSIDAYLQDNTEISEELMAVFELDNADI